MPQVFTNFEVPSYNLDQSGKLKNISPSNIALVKYWGKFGDQLPCNASLSITLKSSHTKSQLAFKPKIKSNSKISLDFYFEGEKNEKFGDKIQVFLNHILNLCPYLVNFELRIDSKNTFPHSSGIASSASSMSSIAALIVELEKRITPKESLKSNDYYLLKSSYLARIGSGSACRSLFDSMSVWGETELVDNSSNEFGVAYNEFHEIFNGIHDSIAIVSSGEKAVSSRAGHALMKTHPFRDVRFLNAKNNLTKLLVALKSGDFDIFCEIVESEALELHGLMMNSTPSFILMAPNTLKIIALIREFRAETKLPICFTLDAGPNVHILYLASVKKIVEEFLEEKIQPLCEGRLLLHDQMGLGTRFVDA